MSHEKFLIHFPSFGAFAHFRILSWFSAQTYHFTMPLGINILLNQTRQQILSFAYITFWQKDATYLASSFQFFFFAKESFYPIWLAAQNFCDKTKKKTFQKGSQFYRLNHIGTNIKHSKPHQVWFLSKKKCFSKKKKKRRIKVLRVKRDHRLSGHLRSLIECATRLFTNKPHAKQQNASGRPPSESRSLNNILLLLYYTSYTIIL